MTNEVKLIVTTLAELPDLLEARAGVEPTYSDLQSD